MTLPLFCIIKAGEVAARCVEYLIGVVASSSRSGHGFTSAAADGVDSTSSRGIHACWSVAVMLVKCSEKLWWDGRRVWFRVWYFMSRWFDYIPFSIGCHTRLTVLVSSYSRVCRSMLHHKSHRGLNPISPYSGNSSIISTFPSSWLWIVKWSPVQLTFKEYSYA